MKNSLNFEEKKHKKACQFWKILVDYRSDLIKKTYVNSSWVKQFHLMLHFHHIPTWHFQIEAKKLLRVETAQQQYCPWMRMWDQSESLANYLAWLIWL